MQAEWGRLRQGQVPWEGDTAGLGTITPHVSAGQGDASAYP